MRKLKNSYWNKFKNIDIDGKETRNGLLFENLIIELLKIIYPGNWKRTKKTHDDNRDFYLITDKSRIWAECKNYKKSIALDTIAPTLVMAQIYSVNKIIFFSYSKINKNAHRKLYSFATSTQKDIIIYEEEQLDDLIIQCNQGISNKFKVSANDILHTTIEPKVDIQFSIIPNPILGTNIEDDDIILYENIDKIIYNNAFEVLVSFDFNKIISGLSIEISCNETDRSNSNYMILENSRIKLSEYNIIEELDGATGYVKSILVKPLFFKQTAYLPIFNISVYSHGNFIASKVSPKINVKYVWNKQTALIGSEYRKAINILQNKILGYSTFGCFLIYGVSGTGKTRILRESLDTLMMYKYRIIHFIGQEKDSAQTLLKELIYFIFEIPRSEIFAYLDACIKEVNESLPVNKQTYTTYDLVKEISKNISDDELVYLVNNYFSIIFEKMSSERIALIIDNVQDFGQPIRIFLEKYINYSRHQSRANRSVLLLSINIDRADKDMLNFIESIKKLQYDNDAFYVQKVAGFKYTDQALVFIKELLNEKSERFDKELEQIIQGYSTVPYYLWQFVYNLLDNEIAYFDDNNKCHIKDPLGFFNVTLTVFDPKEIIEKRWCYLLSKYSFEEEEYICILSLVSLLPQTRKHNIQDFKLNRECLEILVEYNYLRLELDGHYTFDHEIIEKFLLDYYGKKYFAILGYIKKENLLDEIINYPFIYQFYKITQTNVGVDEIKEISDFLYHNNPPRLFMKYFTEELIKKIIGNIDYYCNDEEWLKNISQVTNILRNTIGFEETLNYYDTINIIISKRGIDSFSIFPYFRRYIDTYSDLLHHIRQCKAAISYLKSILNNLTVPADNDVSNALYSMIYNRLLINYREIETELAHYNLVDCYNKSIFYANNIQDENLRNEFLYLNQSDIGYVYYSLNINRLHLLSIWHECKKYTPEVLPQKALNFYRKMVQISLIEQNIDEAEKYILMIRQHLQESTYNTEEVVFNMFCLFSESICLVQKDTVKYYTKLKDNLVELMRISILRGGQKNYEVLNLKAIIAYYNFDYDTMEESFQKAYEMVNTIENTMHLSIKKELIAENIIYAYQSIGKSSSIENIIKKHGNIVSLNTYCARGILCTWDNKFNFIPVV